VKKIKITESYIHGTVSFEKGKDFIKPWRIPFDKIDIYSPKGISLRDKADKPSGVRLSFKTTSKNIQVELLVIAGNDDDFSFDIYLDKIFYKTISKRNKLIINDLTNKNKLIEIWLPQFNITKLKNIIIDDGAKIDIYKDTRKKWITYGSSITHCRGAHSPSKTWPVYVAIKNNLNLLSLGFGGDCHIDGMIAKLIRDTKADYISLKLGINVYGASSLSERTFKTSILNFVDTIREKHKKTPIVLISPIYSSSRETTENSVGMTLVKMREDVKKVYNIFKKLGDNNIYYVDGLKLFNEKNKKNLPDDLHPDGDGYLILGENFSKQVVKKFFK